MLTEAATSVVPGHAVRHRTRQHVADWPLAHISRRRSKGRSRSEADIKRFSVRADHVALDPTETLRRRICCDAQRASSLNVIASACLGSARGEAHEAARISRCARRAAAAWPLAAHTQQGERMRHVGEPMNVNVLAPLQQLTLVVPSIRTMQGGAHGEAFRPSHDRCAGCRSR